MHLIFTDSVFIYDNPESLFIRRYQCPQCAKSYTKKYNLQRHIQLECGQAPQNACLYCPYVARRKNVLLRHMKSFHTTALNNGISIMMEMEN